jgi:tetratricopeptide (TPR) repeat protein
MEPGHGGAASGTDHEGEVVADRFEIERAVGAGGMGEVFRARDRATGATVALKLQSAAGDRADDARFEREVAALRTIEHPAVVRYVAHGILPSGRRWLAMEWLDGEDLAARLRRGPLGAADAVALGRRVAEALAAAHAQGIVHRDLKPANLFLPEGDAARAKIIDFGIARLDWAARATRTGVVVGTLGYMAPEQAQGAALVDARADVFSLGAVLYECVTGEPAFAGENVMAVLVKILIEETPRLGPEAPPGLAHLVARMLAKNRDERPRDAADVAAALAMIDGRDVAPDADAPPGLTRDERRILCVLVVAAAPAIVSPEADTVRIDETELSRAVSEAVAARSGRLRILAGGAIAVTLGGAGAATAQAARAAECALALRALLPRRPMALSTGRATVGRRAPTGEVIDRAAALLAARERALLGASDPAALLPIDIDQVTAGLLDLRFDVAASASGFTLLGQRDTQDAARTLLGKPAPFVGRDRELSMLASIFAECVEEPGARAALVTAPAGAGKSRLRHELLQRIEGRDEGAEVWIARGDPTRAGVPFGMLGQLVRRTARVLDGEPLDLRRQKIAARAGRHADTTRSRRVAEFLGEMVGAPFPDDESVQLVAARRDAALMSDQMRRAWIDFVDAECEARPIVLVLEDLHWGDQPSVDYVGAALRALADRPLFVLALARPEIRDVFPRLWASHALVEIGLAPLSRKAGERLARSVLGDGLGTEAAARLWERAEGNAFFLEELLRAVAEGRGDDLPETVVAMIEERLAALDAEDRRILRAASVLGEVVWESAVERLVGATHPRDLAPRLDRLVREEWLTPRPASRFSGERELAFRHGLVREVAYGMLTPEDRALGHALAGAWLAEVGEPDAVVVAEHFERGGEGLRAVSWWRRAAAEALRGGDPEASIRRVDRAVASGAEGEVRGDLLAIRAEAHDFRGEQAEAARAAREALALLSPGSGRWYAAMRSLTSATCVLGDIASLAEAARTLLAMAETPGPSEQVTTMASVAGWLFLYDMQDDARRLHDALEILAPRFAADPEVTGTVAFYARGMRASAEGDLYRSAALMASAAAEFEKAGDRRRACKAETYAGMFRISLGRHADAAEILARARTTAERLGSPVSMAATRANLALALAHLGRLDEARSLIALAARAPSGDRLTDVEAQSYEARILHLAGDLDAAEAAARRAVESSARAARWAPHSIALLSKVLLARGRRDEALAEARRAAALLDPARPIEMGHAEVLLALAEALDAGGDREGARAAIALARDELLGRAAAIPDPAWRRSYLADVPENARVLALAEAWGA